MRPSALALAVAALLLLAGAYFGARADEERSAWFRGLKQPGTGYGCCDISDCLATKAEYRGESWWAVDPTGRWRKIPPDIIVNRGWTPGDQAYLCAGYTDHDIKSKTTDGFTPYLYCFIPQNMGQ